jgi:hypothetical protein
MVFTYGVANVIPHSEVTLPAHPSVLPTNIDETPATFTLVLRPDRRRNSTPRAYRTSGRRATDQPDLPNELIIDSQTLPAINARDAIG